jgi:hypothetical protein
MSSPLRIDVSFDIRLDAGGRDPDRYSATLRRYHQLLWSKPLPDGRVFDLEDTFPRGYLRHRSNLGDFQLGSDMIIRTFRRVSRMRSVIEQVPETEVLDFTRRGLTVGGTMVFPSNQIGRKWAINQARGMDRKIEDRFDLTLECVRRHYMGEGSPLAPVLDRYSDFFAIFGDFMGYVDFFLLQDLVSEDYREVRFFTPWSDFSTPALPRTLEEYRAYRAATLAFLDARIQRIDAWANG